jgi:hypothetical protein
MEKMVFVQLENGVSSSVYCEEAIRDEQGIG